MKLKWIRVIGIIVGIICLIWFLLPYLWAGIINIGNVTGLSLSVLLILYMLFMPRVHRSIVQLWKDEQEVGAQKEASVKNATVLQKLTTVKRKWVLQKRAQGSRKRLTLKKTLLICLLCIVTLIASLVVIESGCMIRTNMKAPSENATAVVLGCRVYGERPSRSMVERLEAAYEYLIANPEAKCVVSGGQGNGEDISEAEAMYRWLVNKGIEAERIYKEEKSTSTDENIRFSKKVIEDHGLNPNMAIVTSEYHTYRAGIVAEKYGMTYGAIPGKTAAWLFPTYYVRELYGILAEWIWG